MRKYKLTESISFRVVILVIVSLAVESAFITGYFYYNLNQFSQSQAGAMRADVLALAQNNLKTHVDSGFAVIEAFYGRSKDSEALKREKYRELKQVVDASASLALGYYKKHEGDQSKEEIQRAIKEMTSMMRFSGDNYVWINDLHPNMVMHPTRPDLDGKDISGFKDPQGVFLFNEMVKVCKEKGEGVVAYMWTKPGEKEPKPKISYVRLVPELGWIFGSGEWIEDITAVMQQQAAAQLVRMAPGDKYYFVVDAAGKILAHPDPKLIGVDLSTTKDKNGKNFFKEMLDKANQEGSGFVEYVWPKLGKDGVYSKLSYVRMFKPWGWILASGEYIDDLDAKAAAGKARLDDALWSITVKSLVGGFILLAIVIGVSLLLIRKGLNKPMRQLMDFSGCVAGGDLDYCVEYDMQGEMSVLKDGMQAMVNSMREMIDKAKSKEAEAEAEAGRARQAMAEAEKAKSEGERAREEGLLEAAGRLEAVVEGISHASQTLVDRITHASQGSEEQEKRSTETATAMEEMNATVVEVAKNAGFAATQAKSAKDKAKSGAQVVAESIAAIGLVDDLARKLESGMGDLGEKAKAIGAIMNVISDIADQTNLLALNAAIEAARAGEAGRGFAVVADEVRKLAEKTMSATKEVSDAISAIQSVAGINIGMVKEASQAVDKATAMAKDSGQALTEIVTYVDATSDQVASIAAAAEEQTQASEEINRSVGEVNRISMEIAEGTKASGQAVEQLSNYSQDLIGLITSFRSGSSGRKALPGGMRALDGGPKLNCWEFKNCGRQPGGAKVAELGVCAAAEEGRLTGTNEGQCGGRACWAVGGTLCGGKVQGSYAQKLGNCLQCEFYNKVKNEQGRGFVSTDAILERLDKTQKSFGANAKSLPGGRA